MGAAPQVSPIGRVAILGLGLIGGSVGLALRERLTYVVGWDIDSATGRRALECGAVDSVAPTAVAAAAEADVVILSCPLPGTLNLLREITPELASAAVVTDVGSLKSAIVAAADEVLPGRFVGGHPMAGSEAQGIEAAERELFAGKPWLLTPTEQTDPAAVHRVEQVVRAVGAVGRHCSAPEHDRIAATLSHLPHLLAFGLAQIAADLVSPEWRDIAAGSFRDGTRVAASNPELWRVVFQENQSELLASLDRFDDWTRSLRDAIALGDDEGVKLLLQAAHRSRMTF